MNDLKTELTRNATGYVLLLIAVVLILLGAHTGIAQLSASGTALLAAAMLALQAKAPTPPAT